MLAGKLPYQLLTSLLLVAILLLPSSVFAVKESIAVQNEHVLTSEQWFYKAKDYLSKNEYDNAIFAYSKAISLNPQYVEAYNNRGIAYHNKGQYDLAIADYNSAIQLNPQSAEVYNGRGNTYQLRGQHDLAIAD
ncbi:tetratricopeptide repeat protein, partial [Sporomusa malonica]